MDYHNQSHTDPSTEKGFWEPVIVTPSDNMYLLISGERRFLACQQLGLTTIPARVLDSVAAKEEIIALQLTENLHREDLDPIDEANALFAYMKKQTSEHGSRRGHELADQLQPGSEQSRK